MSVDVLWYLWIPRTKWTMPTRFGKGDSGSTSNFPLINFPKIVIFKRTHTVGNSGCQKIPKLPFPSEDRGCNTLREDPKMITLHVKLIRERRFRVNTLKMVCWSDCIVTQWSGKGGSVLLVSINASKNTQLPFPSNVCRCFVVPMDTKN